MLDYFCWARLNLFVPAHPKQSNPKAPSLLNDNLATKFSAFFESRGVALFFALVSTPPFSSENDVDAMLV